MRMNVRTGAYALYMYNPWILAELTRQPTFFIPLSDNMNNATQYEKYKKFNHKGVFWNDTHFRR